MTRPMPKHVAKGDTILALERRYRDPHRRVESLEALWAWRDGDADGDSLLRLALAHSVTRDKPRRKDGEPQGRENLERNWFGPGDDFFAIPGPLPEHYVARLMGVSLIETLEASLGLGGTPEAKREELERIKALLDADPGYGHREFRPVEVTWICGLLRFECFVSITPHQVTLLIGTPGVLPLEGETSALRPIDPVGDEEHCKDDRRRFPRALLAIQVPDPDADSIRLDEVVTARVVGPEGGYDPVDFPRGSRAS